MIGIKTILARWLGVEKQLFEALAQRDANTELLLQYAEQVQDLEGGLNQALETSLHAAGLVRQAHGQMNLLNSRKSAQDKLIEAARLLEGRKPT